MTSEATDRRRDFSGWGPNARPVMLGQQLRAHSAFARAGASFVTLPVLVDSELPSIDRSKMAAWGGVAADIAPTLDLINSKPLRLSAYITASTQLLKQSPIVGASFIESQLLSAIGAAIDDAALNGSGGDQPIGLLNDSEISEIVHATDPTTKPSVADLLEMEEVVANAHGEGQPENMVFLTDPGIRSHFRGLERDASINFPAWTDGPFGGPLGYRGVVSPFAPANTLIFGDMSGLVVLQSGEVEIMSNPYSRDDEGFTRLTITAFFDIVAVSPKGIVRAVTAS